jgi:protein-tyrosine-phosphatase
MAAAFFHRAVGELPVAVSSLGTLDLGAIPPLPQALALGRKLGLDLSAHRTQTLAGNDLSEADLVLGFERMHVITAMVEGRARRERVFTVPELLALLEDERLPSAAEPLKRAQVALARAQQLRPTDPELIGRPELSDPIGGSDEVYRRTASAVREQTERLAAVLFGAPSAAATSERG